MSLISYWVLKDGTISRVSGPWDDFAAANDAPAAAAANVVGRNLFSFIKGDGVLHVYHVIHDLLAGKHREGISFSYRCDGPSLRRDMVMTVRLDDGAFLYESTLIKATPRHAPVDIDYSRASSRIAAMCSFCKRFRYPTGSSVWNPFESILKQVPEPFSISHGMCEDCAAPFSHGYE